MMTPAGVSAHVERFETLTTADASWTIRCDWAYFSFGSCRGHDRRPMKLMEASLYEAIWLAAIGPILDHDTMPYQRIGVGTRLSNAALY